MERTGRLDVDAIEEYIGSGQEGRLIVYASTASTNDIAWQYAYNPDNNGLAVFAEHQSRGRGRRSGRWMSLKGQSILCSYLLLGSSCPLQMVTLSSAVAAAEAIDRTTGLECRIKWPNDLYINDRKLCGILVESRAGRKKSDLVIGIGINCHQEPEYFDRIELAMPATSLDIESGRPTDRNRLAAELIMSVERWVCTAKDNPLTVISRWKELSLLLGKTVELEYDGRKFTGTCIGLDPVKGLVMQINTGSVRIFPAAQTTVVRYR